MTSQDPATGRLKKIPSELTEAFDARQDIYGGDAIEALNRLYGKRDGFAEVIARVFREVREAFLARPEDLRRLDLRRSQQSDWFQNPDRIGYTCYVDQFAGSLKEVESKIPYLKELSITYLHLLPLLKPRKNRNDGGFAVADYYSVNPKFGSMDDLSALAGKLRENDISLCIDFVCNHTSDDHEWAKAARAGDKHYKNYYHFFKDRTLPDQYEKTLKEVFADSAPGNFTRVAGTDEWVWTTFYPFQWDLNYSNPAVFIDMLKTLFFLANQGVEIFRLDSAPFLWKRLGTECQNQPEVHDLIGAYRALISIVAPSVLLNAEAIVPSSQLVGYLGSGIHAGRECQLAYNTTLMTMLWGALAEGSAERLSKVLSTVPPISERSAWITYVRCHDDIGWNVLEEEAGYDRIEWQRYVKFLSDFYSGSIEGSFASGAGFQTRQGHNVHGTSGTLASLCGLELALKKNDRKEIDLAVKRSLLMHSVIFGYGGIPIINMGDELGLTNDRDFEKVAGFDGDGRWLHRVAMNWDVAARRQTKGALEQRIFSGIRALARLRREVMPAGGVQARILDVGNASVLGLHHRNAQGELIILANFAATPHTVSLEQFQAKWRHCMSNEVIDAAHVEMSPYGYVWLRREK